MTSISDIVLRAKNWQVFGAFVAPVAAEFLAPKLVGAEHSRALDMLWNAVDFLLMAGWLAIAARLLNSAVKPDLRLKLSVFYAALVLSAALATLNAEVPGNGSYLVEVLRFSAQLLAIACCIYAVAVVAELFVRAETGERASGTDLVFHSLLIFPPFFLLAGVWYIQPTLNRLHASRPAGSAASDGWHATPAPSPR
jgi:hypothetical protein